MDLDSVLMVSFILCPFVNVCAQNQQPGQRQPGQTHVVSVGRRGENLALRFTPEITIAEVGDLVQFQFYPVNHSVVAADFSQPCIPLDIASGRSFFSGFQPLPPDTDTLTSFTIIVTAPDPVFFYCSQGRHCQQGFVGAINPTEEQSLENFRAAAVLAPENLNPGETPRQSIRPPVASNSPENSAGTSPRSDSRANISNPVRNIGAIVGGVLGGVLFLALILGGLLLCKRKRRQSAELATISSLQKDIVEKDIEKIRSKAKEAKHTKPLVVNKKKLQISRPTPVEPVNLMRNNVDSLVTGLIPIASPQTGTQYPQFSARPLESQQASRSFDPQPGVGLTRGYTVIAKSNPYASSAPPLVLNTKSLQTPSSWTSVHTIEPFDSSRNFTRPANPKYDVIDLPQDI